MADSQAASQLFATLYDELHRLARRHLAKSSDQLTLGVTTLLHEAYLNVSARDSASFPDKAHFLAYASRAMRGLIIDYVRNRQAQKRGGEFELTSFTTQLHDSAGDDIDLAKLSDALDALGKVEPPLAQVVDLKFFCGFSFADIAAMRGISVRTVQREWDKARLFLHGTLVETA